MKTLRQRTAISRTTLSRPMRLALEASLIDENTLVLDYGCGRGDDVQRLRALGITSYGWDPVFRPDGEKREADIVNLGYVANVIEDATERSETLRDAWRLAKKVLIVSARLAFEAKGPRYQRYHDGYLTGRGTFQKFFGQYELREWIEKTIGVAGVAAAPGVFLVFRDEDARQSYLASRYRRKIAVPAQRLSEVLFDRHKELLVSVMNFVTKRGRLPKAVELQETQRIQEIFGSLARAFAVVRRVTGNEQWEAIRKGRSEDLLVYLGLQRFNGRPRFSALPHDLQLDVKAFFRTYNHACKQADELLFSAGRIEAIDNACQAAPCGKLTPEALYVHVSGLSGLPPILRIYEGCASAYIGTVEGANLVKLNRRRPKVSYLSYPDFESDPHPALLGSLTISLGNLQVRYWDYSDSENPPILHRKEEFVGQDYLSRQKFERLTKQEERWRLYEDSISIGTREAWNRLLQQKGVQLRGHRLLRASWKAARP